jgi:cytochrome c-type biogenesis protein CcmH/NrfG
VKPRRRTELHANLLLRLLLRAGLYFHDFDDLERPQTAHAYYLLAAAHMAQGQTTEAASTYQQMVALFPKDPQPPFLLGNVLLAQSRQAEARKAFEQSAVVSPDYMPATERLLDLDIADKQYTAAVGRAQQLIEKDPKRAQPWALRAKVYLAQRDFAHAEPDGLALRAGERGIEREDRARREIERQDDGVGDERAADGRVS